LARMRPQAPLRLGIGGIAGLTGYSYMVLLGGTLLGEVIPEVRILTAILASALVVNYLLQAPRHSDGLDRLILVALLLFLAAAILSQYPRQSLDAALGAFGYAAGLFFARRQLARESARQAFLSAVITLSAVLTFVVAARWLPVVQVWWSSTGFLFPALDLDYP